MSRAAFDRDGTASFNNSSRFAVSSGVKVDNPVIFPPGSLRLDTSPSATMSATAVRTMGIVDVALLAASAPGVP